jgi:hypothetical protein
VRISADLGAIARTHWYEYILRFALGGAVTALTGLIAQHFGPVIGGLFLAFPAIFPASATLVERHERDKKRRAGIASTVRGRMAAGLDAAGAILGAIALIGFAWLVWNSLGIFPTWFVIAGAVLVWLFISACLWWFRKRHWI